MKVKASKKFFASLGDIGPQVQAIAQQFRLDKSNLEYITASAGTRNAILYNNEGQRTWVLYRGEVVKVETVSANTLGALNLNMDICGSSPMPAGCTFVTIEYFMGKYMMTIVNVGSAAIEGEIDQ